MSNHPPHLNQEAMALNPKSLRTKFALRFLKALRTINLQDRRKKKLATLHNNEPFMVAQRYQRVKVAAETSLATAVGPKRAWSRAILIRARTGSNQLLHSPARRDSSMVRRRGIRIGQHRRVRVRTENRAHEKLRRLVPGGEAMDLKSLLGETAHYIKCLSTQVKVMRNLVDYCSSSTI